MNFLFAGFLIAGGWGKDGRQRSAEIFNPYSGHSCSIGNLYRSRHRRSFTICNNILCGGPDTQRSCEHFERNFTFTKLPVNLVESRLDHLCWGLPSGEVLLMGGGRGADGFKTTERVSSDGSTSTEDFSWNDRI